MVPARNTFDDATQRQDELLWRRYAAAPTPRLREELILRYLPLANSLARRYAPGSEPLDDLTQVASMGLVKAIDRFDPERGKPFVAYAGPTILGELRRHFRDRVWVLRLPRGLGERVMQIENASAALSEELGKSPTVRQIAERIDATVEDVLDGLEAAMARRTGSLDAPRGDDEGDIRPAIDHVGGPEPGYERVETQLAAESAALDQRSRDILQMRFGEGLTQTEIAARLGVSQMQISRLSRAALGQLLEAVQAASPNSENRSDA